jgi:hypothetical protein
LRGIIHFGRGIRVEGREKREIKGQISKIKDIE